MDIYALAKHLLLKNVDNPVLFVHKIKPPLIILRSSCAVVGKQAAQKKTGCELESERTLCIAILLNL